MYLFPKIQKLLAPYGIEPSTVGKLLTIAEEINTPEFWRATAYSIGIITHQTVMSQPEEVRAEARKILIYKMKDCIKIAKHLEHEAI